VSYQTTQTSAALRAAQDAWDAHKSGCPDCSSHARNARPCRTGNVLLGARGRAAQAHRAELAADKRPVPGQEALF